jgi:hypothetical protein
LAHCLRISFYLKPGVSNLDKAHYLCPGKPARPAPAELPQDRKVARVGGCSGAMFGLPFFFAKGRTAIAKTCVKGVNSTPFLAQNLNFVKRYQILST